MIIKISVIQNDDEIDFITREISTLGHYNVIAGLGNYNVVAGLINDLFLILRRNFVKNNRFTWIIQQMGNITFTIKDNAE